MRSGNTAVSKTPERSSQEVGKASITGKNIYLTSMSIYTFLIIPYKALDSSQRKTPTRVDQKKGTPRQTPMGI
jgi:hypothetical protein